ADWNGNEFYIIDTGGFVAESEDVFDTEIRKQVRIAMDEGSVILFVVDAATGMADLDDSVADILRRSTKPVFLVVNKVDNNERMLEATEFYSLGFEKLFFISAISGSGTGDLLDEVTALIKEDVELEEEKDIPTFAI